MQALIGRFQPRLLKFFLQLLHSLLLLFKLALRIPISEAIEV